MPYLLRSNKLSLHILSSSYSSVFRTLNRPAANNLIPNIHHRRLAGRDCALGGVELDVNAAVGERRYDGGDFGSAIAYLHVGVERFGWRLAGGPVHVVCRQGA